MSLALLAASYLALAPLPDDPYEENDICQDAAPLVVAPNGQVHNFSFVSSGPASAGGADQDWFRIDVPAAHRIEVSLAGQFPGNPGISTYLRVGHQCGQVLASGFVGGATMRAINASGAVETYFVQLDPVDPNFVQESIFMSVRIRPEVCSGVAPDAFEPNDTLASAPLLPAGLHRGLTLTESSTYDAYVVHVPAGDALRIGFSSARAFGASAYCRVSRHGSSGSTTSIVGVGSGTGVATIVNPTSVDWLVVEVGLDPLGPAGNPCESYDLSIGSTTTPCSAGPDPLEGAFGNDERASATHLTRGQYRDLRVSLGDVDWFGVDIPPGYGARLVVTATDAANPVHAALFHPSYTFTSASSTIAGVEPGELVLGNTGATTLRVDLRVMLRLEPQSIGCAAYGLRVELHPALTTSVHCTGLAHVQGGPVELELFGAASPGTGPLWLTPRDMPQGVFYTATVFVGLPATPPPAASGAFCLAAPVARWVTYGGVGEWRTHVLLDAEMLQPLAGATVAVQQATMVQGLTFLSDASSFVVQ